MSQGHHPLGDGLGARNEGLLGDIGQLDGHPAGDRGSQGLNPPAQRMPVASRPDPNAERIDFDASVAEVLVGRPFPKIPVAVLTKTESFAGLTSFPGLSADELNRLYEQAHDAIVALAPTAPHLIATGSEHCIQCSQPDLVVQAAELVEPCAAAQPWGDRP